MKLKCIQYYTPIEIENCGLTIGTYYQILDKNQIGYKVIDNLGRNFWYSIKCFEKIEEKRNNLIKELVNIS